MDGEHAAAPRSVLHTFGAPTRESAQLCAGALNDLYGPSGGSAAFTGAEIDLMDLDALGDEPTHPFQVVFEHEAIVDDGYLDTVRQMEAIAERTGVEYEGWEADEGEGLV